MKTLKTTFSTLVLVAILASAIPTATFASTEVGGNIIAVERCGNIEVPIKDYGAGLMYQGTLAQTFNEHPLINLNAGCAVLEWQTNVPATSQVIFSEFVTGEPVDIDMTVQPHYGYDSATTQNNSGDVYHQAVLSGLEPGKAYAYRIVSRSHPSALPVLSQEYVLVMAGAPAVTSTTTTPVVNADTTPIILTTETPVETVDATISPLGDEDVVLDATTTDEATTTADDTTSWFATALTWLKNLAVKACSALKSAFSKDSIVLPFILIVLVLGIVHRLLLPFIKLTVPAQPYWVVASAIIALAAWFAGWHALAFTLGALALLILAWALLVYSASQDEKKDDTPEKKKESVIAEKTEEIKF